MKAGPQDLGAFDVVIVGGGTAGCVMANRLSANPACRVALIEAGRDLPPGGEGAAILDMYPGGAAFDPANHWPGMLARLKPASHNAAVQPSPHPFEQARLMGGGSSINGQVANRGTPADYDEWASLGATGWSWADVLPYFRKLERDLDFAGPLHGSEGPIPIHRIPEAGWPAFSTAARAALIAAGYPDIRDQNGCFEDGVFAQTLSNDGTHRVSTAMAYLDQATRARSNLRIIADAEVTGLTLDQRRVAQLRLMRGGEVVTISAGNVVLCAGALRTPELLMRSGIGPAAQLREHGINVLLDRPGIGANLQEHPGISLSAFLMPAARLRDTTRRHIHLAMRLSSNVPGAPEADLYLMAAAKSAWHPLGRRIGTLIAWLNKTHSRGNVRLERLDGTSRAVASFNMLADDRDLVRLSGGLQFMAGIMRSPELAPLVRHVSPSRYSGFAKRLGRITLANYALTAAASVVLDLVPAARAPFFRRFVSGGLLLDDLVADEAALQDYVRENVFGQWHACGTCRLGPADDATSVTDPITGRLHGLDNLFIADASVMPTAPRANLNIPVIMIAEKTADQIRRSDLL